MWITVKNWDEYTYFVLGGTYIGLSNGLVAGSVEALTLSLLLHREQIHVSMECLAYRILKGLQTAISQAGKPPNENDLHRSKKPHSFWQMPKNSKVKTGD